MELKEFMKELSAEVEASLENIMVTETEIMKNNSVTLNGLAIRKKGEKIAPILYVDLFFKKFKKGELTMPDIVKKVITEYKALPPHNIPDFTEWLSDGDLLGKISVRLVNKEANEGMIATRKLVSYDIPDTDLVALFYLKVIAEEESVAETAINEYMFKEYLPDIEDEKELYYEVLSRVQAEDVRFEPMQKVISRLIEKAGGEEVDVPIGDVSMFVLTNKNMIFGTSMILTEVARQMIVEEIPTGKATILPSSTHELILIPTSDDENIEELKSMVMIINNTELSQEEKLSDNIFHFDANTGEFRIANEV